VQNLLPYEGTGGHARHVVAFVLSQREPVFQQAGKLSVLQRWPCGGGDTKMSVTPVSPDRCGHVASMVIEREESGFLGIFLWRFAYLYVLVLFSHLGQHSVHLYPNEHHQTYHVEPGQKDYTSP
jgi:hypothetical protein